MAARILVVEDNALNMKLVSDLLTLYGFDVLQASTGAYALVLAEEQHPDLILMDIALRGMNGLQVSHLLTQNPNTAGIPIVAVTAYAGERDRQYALESGCVGFIAKPIDTRRFPAQVAQYLKEVSEGASGPAPSAAGC